MPFFRPSWDCSRQHWKYTNSKKRRIGPLFFETTLKVLCVHCRRRHRCRCCVIQKFTRLLVKVKKTKGRRHFSKDGGWATIAHHQHHKHTRSKRSPSWLWMMMKRGSLFDHCTMSPLTFIFFLMSSNIFFYPFFRPNYFFSPSPKKKLNLYCVIIMEFACMCKFVSGMDQIPLEFVKIYLNFLNNFMMTFSTLQLNAFWFTFWIIVCDETFF